MNDNTKVLAGMLAGLAAGVAIGILFAPDKGSETRVKLNDSLRNLGDTIRERATDEFGNLSQLKDKVVDGIKSKMKTAGDEYANTRNGVNSVVDRTEDSFNNATKV